MEGVKGYKQDVLDITITRFKSNRESVEHNEEEDLEAAELNIVYESLLFQDETVPHQQ